MNKKAADIICKTRENKECAYFDVEKFSIISSSRSLSDTAKLIWIKLSAEASKNTVSDAWCLITEEEIAEKTNNTIEQVCKALTNLTKEGFLDVELIEGGQLKFFPKCPIAN